METNNVVRETDLSKFANTEYKRQLPGQFRLLIWYLINALIFKSSFIPFLNLKLYILRKFGCKLGRSVVIKPSVNIKYPWNLEIGNNTWIGENVWIDNLAHVAIGSNVCISQGAMLLTGNHDYKKSTFDLIINPIIIEDGVWICAKSIVCPGVVCRSHSILTVASIATKDLESFTIYQGNPAVVIKKRTVT